MSMEGWAVLNLAVLSALVQGNWTSSSSSPLIQKASSVIPFGCKSQTLTSINVLSHVKIHRLSKFC